MLEVWHGTADAPRRPRRVSAQERVAIDIGTWPIEPGQTVRVRYRVRSADGSEQDHLSADAYWQRNEGVNSYWTAEIGPFADGVEVFYAVRARSPSATRTTARFRFRTGPKVHLALLWHQHQPVYKDTRHHDPRGSYAMPWVRMHAVRDYYGMAQLLREQPEVHATINFTPSLIWQIADYLDHGATDRALELSRKPPETLTAEERAEVLETCFQADPKHQILVHPRYAELFAMRRQGDAFSPQDLIDLQMWWNLAWFPVEMREGEVELVTGERASARRFVEQARGFAPADLDAMYLEQWKVLRAVVPVHREAAAHHQVELASSPFAHPILPLLVDTDHAVIDREGASHPERFAYPQDAAAQLRRGLAVHEDRFEHRARGLWPPEGAVSEASAELIAETGLAWIATDAAVLDMSGVNARSADLVAQPWRLECKAGPLAIFFRDTELSDSIGFRYAAYEDPAAAARDFVDGLLLRFAARFDSAQDRVVTVIVDGENAWGSYDRDGRPFLRALYAAIASTPSIRTVTFSEWIDGNPARGLLPHPVALCPRLERLATGSWIDERGSRPGHDLGTWIGEDEENRAWEMLLRARRAIDEVGATAESAPDAFDALFMAEGSDWFWWFGEDQTSGHDHLFDAIFRAHVRNIYRGLGRTPPADLDEPLLPRPVVYSAEHPVDAMDPRDELVVIARCAGQLTWWLDDAPAQAREVAAKPVGGVMAGTTHHQVRLGPFPESARTLAFRFACAAGAACGVAEPLCRGEAHEVRLRCQPARGSAAAPRPITLP